MADAHQRELHEVLQRAKKSPTLLEALEILFTAHCGNAPHVEAAFVVDLFAEAGRNPHVSELVRGVMKTAMDGVTSLIKQSPEAKVVGRKLKPRELAELIFAVNHGALMHDVLDVSETPDATRRKRQLTMLRNLWRVLLEAKAAPARR